MFVSKVISQCPEPSDTTSCFFNLGHICFCFITMDSGVKQHLWGLDSAYYHVLVHEFSLFPKGSNLPLLHNYGSREIELRYQPTTLSSHFTTNHPNMITLSHESMVFCFADISFKTDVIFMIVCFFTFLASLSS